MKKIRLLGFLSVGIFAASPGLAASWTANAGNLAAVLAKARGGDSVTLQGRFGATRLSNLDFSAPVRINAWNATFTDTLTLSGVNNLSFRGGKFGSATSSLRLGRAVSIYSSANIGFALPTVLGKSGGVGIYGRGTNNLNVSDGNFLGLRVGIVYDGVTRGEISANTIRKSVSDGINIVDSHFITARGNSCGSGSPTASAHPDCIQLWSILGNAVQSDIALIDNYAYGATQGFTSFDSSSGGGLRISMIGNRIDTSLPQGIACYGCFDSVFSDNVLTTLPGSRSRTSINIIGGANNTLSNNSIGPRVAAVSAARMLGGVAAGNGFAGADPGAGSDEDVLGEGYFGVRDFEAEATPAPRFAYSALNIAAVPEPGVWLQLLCGFAGIGWMLRRRSASAKVLVQE